MYYIFTWRKALLEGEKKCIRRNKERIKETMTLDQREGKSFTVISDWPKGSEVLSLLLHKTPSMQQSFSLTICFTMGQKFTHMHIHTPTWGR